MEELCKNCQHFEPKGVVNGKNTYGLCPMFVKRGKPGVFRWGDACCVNFKPNKEANELQSRVNRY